MNTDKITLIQIDPQFLRCSETLNPVAQWDGKKCTWIVLPEYEETYKAGLIKRGDTAGCQTLAEYIADNSNWDKLPDITVIWTSNTPENHAKCCDCSVLEVEKYSYPLSWSRSWGHLDFINTMEEAIEQLGYGYCNWGRKADKFEVIFTLSGKTETKIIENQYGHKNYKNEKRN